jgi:hypothetical protein
VRRGDREVVRNVAGNRAARISPTGFFRLIKRAETDDALAETVGARPDIPPQMFQELLTKATAVVHRRLLASANPEFQAEIRRVLSKVSHEVGARVGPRDYRNAQRIVLNLHRGGRLDEAALTAFASEGKFEETVVALATLVKVPLAVADRLMASEQPDPILILGKAAALSWPTVKAIIMVRPNSATIGSQTIDAAFGNYDRLSTPTAQRVVRFWQVRQSA